MSDAPRNRGSQGAEGRDREGKRPMSKIKDELTFRHAVDEVMSCACSIAADHLSELKDRYAEVFAGRLGDWDGAGRDVINTYFTAWSMLSDDLPEGGVLGVVIRDFPWLFDERLLETARQVRDTVRWRAMAIDKVDTDALMFEVSDLGTGEAFTLHVDERLAARRTCDHQGTLSGFVATVDGVTCIVGPSSYDRAPAGSNELWKEGPLFLYTTLLSGAMNAKVFCAE